MTEATMERETPVEISDGETTVKTTLGGLQDHAASLKLADTKLAEIFERNDISDSTTAAFRAVGLTTLRDLAEWLNDLPPDNSDKLPPEIHFIRDIPNLSQNACTAAIGVLAAPLLELGVDLADEIRDDDQDKAEGEAAASLRRISEIEDEVADCELRWTVAKENASAAKKSFDAAVERLRKAIRASKEGAGPLFEKKTAEATTTMEPQADDSWKQLPLTEVLHDIPEKKVQVLVEAGFETLGKFVEFQAKKGEYKWDLPGIGAEWRAKIENSILNWFDKHWAKTTISESESAVTPSDSNHNPS